MFFKLLSFVFIIVVIKIGSICWSLLNCCNKILFSRINYASSIKSINLISLHALDIAWLVFFYWGFNMNCFFCLVFLHKCFFFLSVLKVILFLIHVFFNSLFFNFRFFGIFFILHLFRNWFGFLSCIFELLGFLFKHLSFWMLVNEVFGSFFGSI